MDVEVDVKLFSGMEKFNVDPMDRIVGRKDELCRIEIRIARFDSVKGPGVA